MNVNTQIAAGNKKTKRAFVFRCVFISRSCDGSRAVLNLARLSGMEGSTPDSLIEFTCSLLLIDSSPIADLDPNGQ